MPKISIIMPVYNGKLWLTDSINSVINQTFKDFELICVNDSSTDNSEEILKEFSNKDSRVKYFTKENEGPGMALNFGIEKAQGEYLCFIDQDDKYDNEYLEKMLSVIEKYDCNMVLCNAYFWEEDKLTRIPYPEKETGILNIKTGKKKNIFAEMFFPQWTKIIKKEFVVKNNIKFPGRENKSHDVPFHCKLIGLCDEVGYIKDCLYYHRIHKNQITSTINVSLDYLISIQEIFQWLKENNFKYDTINNFKDYLKAMILPCAQKTRNIIIIRELRDFVKQNYGKFEGLVLKCIIRLRLNKLKRKLKKARKNHKILTLEKINLMNVGEMSYCTTQPAVVNPKTSIGNFVSIGMNVRLGHGIHPLHYLSTSPYFYFDKLGWKRSDVPSHNEYWNYAPIQIGNDVWIGDNVIIKNGIKIGDGAVVGMGSIVTKDVPPFAIVAGVPAKIIKYRFDEETIKKLLKLKWWYLDGESLRKIHYDDINLAILELNDIRNN